MRAGRVVQSLIACTALLPSACGFPNHHLIHPLAPAADVVTWTADFQRDGLLVHVEGARPAGSGPFPAVLVHPEGGKTAPDMRGVIWDLAGHGYVALAADYRRWSHGAWRRNVIAWRSLEDARLLLDVTRAYPEIDQQRIGALGFSQGGVFSLLMAAHAPDRVRAVVAYYPVTDFPHWFARPRSGMVERFVWSRIRAWFRRESEAASDAEFETMLRHASAWYVAEDIRAPVLLLHGARDALAPVEESRRMAERLAAAGRTVELIVPDEGVHLFNFRQPLLAASAWTATLDWLDRWVRRASA
jgi:dienelactone hydrolase